MMIFTSQLGQSPLGQRNSGSILIYVLWILVVISTLAFHLASENRVTTLSQSAFAKQLKAEMQLQSAIQFSIFKIISNQWQDKDYKINLNNQEISISIWNESGFVSIYQPGEILDRVYESLDVPASAAESMLEAFAANQEKSLRLNSFHELKQFPEMSESLIQKLIPLVSIYKEEEINPEYSSVAVLDLIPGVDRFRVRKMKESEDIAEKSMLRRELIDLLTGRNLQFSDYQDAYFRVRIKFANRIYRVFLKYDRRQKTYKVATIEMDT